MDSKMTSLRKWGADFVGNIKLSKSAPPRRLKLRLPAGFDEVELLPGIVLRKSGEKYQLVVEEEFEIVGRRDVSIRSDQHLFIDSGKTQEPGRPAYRHSIWQNQRVRDAENRPVELVPFYDADGRIHKYPLPLCEDGTALVDDLGWPVSPVSGLTPLPAPAWENVQQNQVRRPVG